MDISVLGVTGESPYNIRSRIDGYLFETLEEAHAYILEAYPSYMALQQFRELKRQIATLVYISENELKLAKVKRSNRFKIALIFFIAALALVSALT